MAFFFPDRNEWDTIYLDDIGFNHVAGGAACFIFPRPQHPQSRGLRTYEPTLWNGLQLPGPDSRGGYDLRRAIAAWAK
jgi:hypothetical protein